ncbi:hypothetical protein TYRP_016885 [Tyrophagus putrescentiae]|nr:hypothetical protein TYRP_016885 [Tyrophagus putrescentiae]
MASSSDSSPTICSSSWAPSSSTAAEGASAADGRPHRGHLRPAGRLQLPPSLPPLRAQPVLHVLTLFFSTMCFLEELRSMYGLRTEAG